MPSICSSHVLQLPGLSVKDQGRQWAHTVHTLKSMVWTYSSANVAGSTSCNASRFARTGYVVLQRCLYKRVVVQDETPGGDGLKSGAAIDSASEDERSGMRRPCCSVHVGALTDYLRSDRNLVSARALGAIERRVGCSDQSFAERLVIADFRLGQHRRHTDREADHLLHLGSHGNRLRAHGLQHAQGNAFTVNHAALLQHHRKFIAAKARARIARAQL